ncbi:MAG: hypothetical protein L0099_09465 [Acidobacteria bacterium]|nr:hypothetical protein [Acidobacteriota bacterium]
MTRRTLLGTLIVLLALAAFSPVSAQDGDDIVLKFKRMFAVNGPFGNAADPPTPLRGLSGARAPWAIQRVNGQLNANGRLEVHVRGLIVPLPFLGRNPIASFRAVVSCRSVDSAGNAIIANVHTDTFPATSTGDADIEQFLTLPSPCVAPIVFITSPGLSWLAVTGQ